MSAGFPALEPVSESVRALVRTEWAAIDGGSIWTWVVICAETKLVPCFLVGDRDGVRAKAFVADLRSHAHASVFARAGGDQGRAPPKW